MKISVIIPTYKPKDYLWECLNSLTEQTFSKNQFEIILVLNGCCEPWKSDIEAYIATNMRGMNINFIQLQQGGVSNARNVALDNAKGKYITFIDDDDMVSPQFLQELYNAVTPEIISVCKPLAFWEGKEGYIDYSITNTYNKFSKYDKVSPSKVRKYFSGPCMKLIPMSFIQDRRYDIRFKNGEDSIFMFLISDRISKVSFTTPNAIYYRRFREGSAMTINRSRWAIAKNNLNMMKVYCEIYLKAPWRYNFLMFITRVLGAVHSILDGVKRV